MYKEEINTKLKEIDTISERYMRNRLFFDIKYNMMKLQYYNLPNLNLVNDQFGDKNINLCTFLEINKINEYAINMCSVLYKKGQILSYQTFLLKGIIKGLIGIKF